MQSSAIVSYKPEEPKSLNWKYENVTVRDTLTANEVLVEVSAVGLCHTDVFTAFNQTEYASILGHEGNGKVLKVGSAVTNCAVGDPVLLSYRYCNSCRSCKRDYQSYCESFNDFNLIVRETEEEGSFKNKDGKWAKGKFFGQSSFSKLTIVDYTLIVNLKGLDLTQEQMDKLGPLGCGLQTGSGAILNSGGATKDDSVVVYGLGGVGLAGIMAAKIAGSYPIIAVDLFQSKIDAALELGATHGIVAGDDDEVRRKILEITGSGPDLSFECVGGTRFVETAIKNAANRGRIVFVGISGAQDEIKIPAIDFLVKGKQLIACVEGESYPPEFIPKLINYYLEGKFNLDKIEKQYPIEKFQEALDDIKTGKVIKPILKF